MPVPSKIIFFGHHKCGSRFFRMTLMQSLATANHYSVLSYDIQNPLFEFETAHDLDLHNIDFDAFRNRGKVVLNLSNAGAPVVDRINALDSNYIGVHVVRDPRQLLVSNYFYHREGHKITQPGKWVWRKLETDRPVLQRLPIEEGLNYELENITRDVFEHQLVPWRGGANIIEFKLEEFSPDKISAQKNVEKLAAFCGFEEIPALALQKQYANEGAQKHWQELFTPALKKKFKDRYGELVVKFGYEKDNSW